MASVAFEPLEDGDGLVVTDAIEQRRCEFRTDDPVDPKPSSTAFFPAPLDAAVSFRTSKLSMPKVLVGYIRNEEGSLVDTVGRVDSLSLESGHYIAEFSPPIKLYITFDGPCEISASGIDTTFEFEKQQSIRIGARSYHDRPEATLETTSIPEDMMQVISYLGSALKTTSSERSFPTLRGHPPAIEVGDRVHIPDELEKPETGVTLQVPTTLEAVFASAPLAYYLGADVVPGTTPRLATNRGFVYPLDGSEGFEGTVERVLKQVFFLDCLTRTEGLYPVDLHERRSLESVLGFDFEALYEQSLAEQLETYLSVSFSVLEDHLPTWKLTAHVDPEPKNVETLPFLIDDLAVVRSPTAKQVTQSEAHSEAIKAFMRSDMTRSTAEYSPVSAPTLVQPETVDSIEQTWVGDHAPIGATKASIQAFRNRLDKKPNEGDISITVVCNDANMAEEHDDVRNVYGKRESLPFDVTFYENLTTDRLRFVLESDIDFFHYIGHIEDGGFKCSNGLFDARKLENTAIDAFFLNACRSYTQGMALIERGAIGGVVTLDEVINSGAIRVGGTMAKFLNHGFPLGSALDIASEQSIVGTQYIVLGDSGLEVAQAQELFPSIYEITPKENAYSVVLQSIVTRSAGIGSVISPRVPGHDGMYLASGKTPAFEVTPEDLDYLLAVENIPVRIDGEIAWGADLELDW